MQEYITKSAEETQKIAKEFAKTLKGGEIFIFSGDLGAGKTTFIQGLAEGLGVKENLTSPTFVLMKIYKGKGSLKLVHIDCYRIGSGATMSSLGLDEIFEDKNNIAVVEWGERIADILPNDVAKIEFKHLSKNQRVIKI
ncbi:MAG: tRNA (adenosine(37)-N6)-threonylcarbamoyltransferase complex ATPase subunit type 1 TsaE [bacterium]